MPASVFQDGLVHYVRIGLEYAPVYAKPAMVPSLQAARNVYSIPISIKLKDAYATIHGLVMDA